MNRGRNVFKHKMMKQHRKVWYERYLDKLINGNCKPVDVTLRWKKLKQVK